MRTLFGTDGIRGTANTHPMTADLALKLGLAAARYFVQANRQKDGHRHRVVIAKDTRLSGYMLEPALTAGFVSAGMDVILVGPLPTPAVAMLTRSLRADLGVMISASHNPYQDNGIKLFGPDGFKLSDEVEQEIERRMANGLEEGRASPDKLGRAKRLEDARGRYIEYVKQTFPRDLRLKGLKIVIDCAHGAAYQIGPTVLWELGAEVISIGISPDGFNINKDCGSTHPEAMCKKVREEKADLGIALDGDADRLIMCDEKGELIDGDQLMGMIAARWQREGKLTGGGVVATLMSNLGLERYLAANGLSLQRTKVGDRYVMEKMREGGFNLGGEQSGHIILSDYSTTGDGLIAALQVLAGIVTSGKSASHSCRIFTPLPQLLKNVRYSGASPLENSTVQQAIADAEKKLGARGRILVRKSGTEPLIRVMAEGEDQKEIETVVESVAAALQKTAA